MDKKPPVTVIIPNYNHAIYLSERILSILNQTYQNFDLIILDDCSTDNSKEIIEEYRHHPKVSEICYNDTNSGNTFKQWEKGINQANGEYILIAESDDWCEPNLLEYLIQGIKQDPECVLSYCQSYCIHESNTILWQSSHNLLSEMIDGKDFIKKHMVRNNTIFNAGMVLWKKEVFLSISNEFVSYKYCGDWLFWIEVCTKGKVHIDGRLLNYFRKHGNDVTGKANKSGLNFIENLRITNWLYTHKLIEEHSYKVAFKVQHNAYWPLRKKLDINLIPDIKKLFYTPLSPKITKSKLVFASIKEGFRKSSNR